ncbi:MAG: hypothetical protein B7Y02_07195 [Rhodobacterales bacterium 17-64-5]|nr:MAG: hypothetical protein B7Y02_07195 [Rhodobacterales bacterium 17-64-5]
MSPAEARPVKTSPFRVIYGLAALLSATSVQAAQQLNLQFPGPSETTLQRSEALASFRLAVGPYQSGEIATELTEGALDQTAWRIAVPGSSTLEMIQSLRAQIAAAGFKVIFECETEACGGYDFRYGTEVVAEPDMHVDLGDFRYVAAERPSAAGPELIALVVSRSADQGFVQVTTITPLSQAALALSGSQAGPATAETAETQSAAPALTAPTTPDDFGASLLARGSVALDDLIFASGSAALEDKDYASLTALAAWLAANPTRQVTLVGHTDAVGTLAANTGLSRQRAASVRATLIARFGAQPGQIDAQGAGYLAPRATNETPEGRTQNRRVEVILTPAP